VALRNEFYKIIGKDKDASVTFDDFVPAGKLGSGAQASVVKVRFNKDKTKTFARKVRV